MTHHAHTHDVEETALTIGGSVVGSIFSHVFCCGLLPMAFNASAGALLSSIEVQIGFAIITTLMVAMAVTLYEKRRHKDCNHRFNIKKHLIKNSVVGGSIYFLVYTATHLPGMHEFFERYLGI